jgi:microcin C transport system substrate-binding protein
MHGMSVFGDLKYPADFKQFDYVNPDAPKGGLFSTIPSTRAYNQSFQTFNSFNAFILKGEGAKGMELTFDTLMARANDEPDAMYGLAAKSVWISTDKLTYRFTMRPEARFHDGSKMTAHDVAFSLNTLKEKGHPLIVVQLRDMVKAEVLDDATVAVMFAPNRARDVPLYVASLPIFSKAYYATRPFEESTTDIPLGSGPYKVGKYEINRYVEFDRVKDYWAADLPSIAAATISAPCATNSIATATWRSRALPARTISTARSSPRASGPPLRFSRDQGRPGQARDPAG